MQKKWKVKDKATEEFKKRFSQYDDLVLQLLFNRDLDSQEKIDEFLNPDYINDIHDPFLFKDMNTAVDRIFKAIDNNENIVVHGDYDADGVTGSVIMVKTLHFLGAKNVDVFLPHREKDGYGLNKNSVNNFKKNDCNLIITNDCGISSIDEIVLANELGIDVIITDHHHAPEKLPPAFATINPKVSGTGYPFDQLAGVGIAFKLTQALLVKSSIDQKKKEAFEKWFLDLVAVGTIADCSPIVGENRTLIKYGLVVLNKTNNLGMRKLIEYIGCDTEKVKLNTFNIGFQISPRINAAGRMNHANVAFNLLMSEDKKEAKKLSIGLTNTNKQRQKQTEYIFKEAKKQALEQTDDYCIVAFGADWSVGIMGLVAGKLAQEFNRPAIVIVENDNKFSGSARSIEQFNVVDALGSLSDLLMSFGGHSQAAGFTLKDKNNLDKFKKRIEELSKKELQNSDLRPVIDVENEIKLTNINWNFFENLEKFEPFGEGNFEPIFLVKKVEVVEMMNIGKDEKHLKLKVMQDNKIMPVIGFNFGKNGDMCGNLHETIKIGSLIDILVYVTINEWNSNRELQLRLVDIKSKQ